MVIKINQEMSRDIWLGFQIIDAEGTECTVAGTTGNVIENGILRKAGKVGEVYTVNFSTPYVISSVAQFGVYLRTATYKTDGSGEEWITVNPFYFDYLCAEYDVASNATNQTLTEEQTSVEMDILSGLSSTVFSDEEMENAQVTATYKVLPNGSDMNPTISDNKISITNLVQETDYQVTLSVAVGNKSLSRDIYLFGHYDNILFDFEGNGTCGDDATVVGGGISGKGLLFTAKSWTTYQESTSVTLTKDCTTVSFWVYAPNACSATSLTSTGWLYTYGTTNSHLRATFDTLEFTVGWNYVQYELQDNVRSAYAKDKAIDYLSIHGKSLGVIIDRIALK